MPNDDVIGLPNAVAGLPNVVAGLPSSIIGRSSDGREYRRSKYFCCCLKFKYIDRCPGVVELGGAVFRNYRKARGMQISARGMQMIKFARP